MGVGLKRLLAELVLSVSSFSKYKDIAVDFAQWITNEEIQCTFYLHHGGQPAHCKAWTDKEANTFTNNFFKNVLPVMNNGYIRPRYNGYLHFQDNAGLPLQKCLLGELSVKKALNEMNNIYQQSLHHKPQLSVL